VNPRLVLEELWIYPVKSCAGIAVDELEIEKQGPRWDRQWMIVDEAGGFVSQRKFPKMAKIKTALIAEGLRLQLGDETAASTIEISAETENQPLSVKVWNSNLLAYIEPESVNHKISEFLGQKVFLVRHGSQSFREVQKSGAGLGAEVRFADGFPFLLTNKKSLEELNSKLKTLIPMSRFRSNLVVNFPKAYAEDHWKSLSSSSGLVLEFAKPCSRCVMITIDQKTGEPQGSEPTAVLAKTRIGSLLGPNFDEKGIYFGMNLVHRGVGKLVRGESLDLA
jgi:uncharacterized protein